MQRIKEEFLERVEAIISLGGLVVLEIGCGDGSRSIAIAKRCRILNAIEPDEGKIKLVRAQGIPNAIFEIGSGESLSFNDESFDMVIFTLSLHHISTDKMGTAIDEAVRVVRKTGHIVFLEPTETGTFFDAEIKFDMCDGDERREKAMAYKTMINHKKLKLVQEIDDETIFQFQSVADLVNSMGAKKNMGEIEDFLESNHYILKAGRRINIFQPCYNEK